jgi:hypothetical protein
LRALWDEYKPAVVEEDESDIDSDAEAAPRLNQYQQYGKEHRLKKEILTSKDSPIPYWISKQSVWPQLAQMAFDIYSTPAMSDALERVFSIAGNVYSPRRRTLTQNTVQEVLYLRSW